MTEAEINALVDRMLNHIASHAASYDDFKVFLEEARNRDDLKLMVRKHLEKSSIAE